MASFPKDGHDPLAGSRPSPGIDPDLHDVAQRVHAEFDDRLDPRIVDECLDHVAAQFAGASIRSFVPLLVRRYVREELQARHRQIELKRESQLPVPASESLAPQLPSDGDTPPDTASERRWMTPEALPGT